MYLYFVYILPRSCVCTPYYACERILVLVRVFCGPVGKYVNLYLLREFYSQ